MSRIKGKTRFSPADTIDILRMEQRDKEFIDDLQVQLSEFTKLWLGNDSNKITKYSKAIAETLYYLATSCRNLQTIGEEYAGIIRILGKDKRATFLVQVAWLLFYIYGSTFYVKALTFLENYISSSEDLLPNVKEALLKFLSFLKVHKEKLLMIHQSLFYIGQSFYHISNRILGMRYIHVNPFLGDNSASGSFKLFGKLSIIYLLVYLSREYVKFSRPQFETSEIGDVSSKFCVLCSEPSKNVSATPCGHLYCWECIFDSLKHDPRCPICREDIKASRIVHLKNYS